MSVTATSPLSGTALVGESAAFQDMLAHVSALAPLNRPALILGERGAGKELVAHRLMFLSPRWNRPFITLNCGALADTLLDSELFGHEAGAFTGAARRRASRFELADTGTMFLDEIGNAPPAVQEKLLRLIEYGSFERVGGNDTVRVDVRLIAATNADLRSTNFRADLLDRLAFDVIRIPPLRERQGDAVILARHFAARMTAELPTRRFPRFFSRRRSRARRAPLARQRPRAPQHRGAQRLPDARHQKAAGCDPVRPLRRRRAKTGTCARRKATTPAPRRGLPRRQRRL